MPCDRRRSPRLVAASLAAIASSVALTGCLTGERPTLVPETPVNDEAIQAVLDRLERAELNAFTATYQITPSSTGLPTTATVRQTQSGRRRITIGEVDYLIDGSVVRTCENNNAGCVDFLDDARISDMNITHRFWGSSFASRLRIDAARNLAPGVGRAETIGGQSARCVDIAVVGGTVVYCALDAGVLARYFGADVTIELTSFSFRADENELDL